MSNIENTNGIENENEVTETAVAVVTPTSDITSLFANIDVAGLNAAITDIANRQTNLTDKEKEFAVSVVNQWETGVVEQLSNENQKVLSFVQYVKNFSSYYNTLIDNPEYDLPLASIIGLAGAEDKAAEFKDAIDEVKFADEDVKAARSSYSEANDPSLTEFEALEKRYLYEKEMTARQADLDKATRKRNRIASELSAMINKNPDVRTALNKLTSFARLLTKSKNECATKANSAKLAIAIDDKDLRDKLNALISIAVK